MFYKDLRKKLFCVTLSMMKEGSGKSRYGDDSVEMSPQEKNILRTLCGKSPRLPYPTRKLCTRVGAPAEEYIIPDDKRLEVLQGLYPFYPCPALDDWRFDLHEGKMFCVREYRVIRDHDCNFLVSPYYPDSGGMVIDWLDSEDEHSPLWVKKTLEEMGDGNLMKILGGEKLSDPE